MSNLINAMKRNQVEYTKNGGQGKSTSGNALYDLFALGAAYRNRSDEDCIFLFKKAYNESPTLAMKCLFYLRDVYGAGERRFFRVCFHWLACTHPEAVRRNMNLISTDMCRWDDIYCLMDTPLEQEALTMMRDQIVADYTGDPKDVSLVGKWAKSCNSSSAETKRLGEKTRRALGLSPRQYRKVLSELRSRIRIVERLMSFNQWDSIDFSKLPSKAGLKYMKAFKRHTPEAYREFASSKTTHVNAGTLYPYDVVREAIKVMNLDSWFYMFREREPEIDEVKRQMVNKYWSDLKDYFAGAALDALVVCDTSASMTDGGKGNVTPINVAVSLAMYAAERNHGPFANHYISFSRQARLVEVEGIDFCDKVARIVRSNVCENTNLTSVFELLINTILSNNLKPSDVPASLIIITDGEIDRNGKEGWNETTMNVIRNLWREKLGDKFVMPHLIYWTVTSRNRDIMLEDADMDMSLVSGCSPSLFTQLISGKSGIDVMMDVLNSPRYQSIT